MEDILINIAAGAALLTIVVMVHELGHFAVARCCGMKVLELALGFGPKLLSREYNGTVYSIRALPFGGFNNIHGTDFESDKSDASAFRSKHILAKTACLAAGPIMNILLSFSIMMYFVCSVRADVPVKEATVGSVSGVSGIMAGDMILSVDGVPVTGWDGFSAELKGKLKPELELRRDGKVLKVRLEGDGSSVPSLKPKTVSKGLALGPAAALAAEETKGLARYIYDATYKMLVVDKEVNVSGPIVISKVSGDMAKESGYHFAYMVALISVNLAMMNLIPIPVFDGGLILLFVYNEFAGHKIDQKWFHRLETCCAVLLFAAAVTVSVCDILRLI